MTNRVKLGCVAHVRDSDDKGNDFNPIYRFAAGFLPCGRAVSGVRAAALRVLTEERIFLAEFDCEHVRNIPTFDWAFPERSRFTTFCHRKVAPKVSAEHLRRDRTEQCGICGALRATMIICWSPVLAGLRPAGPHCEKSGKIPTLHCIPSGTTNPVILRRKSKPIPTQASPPASPRKQRRKRPCPIGFRHICPKTEK